jgi:pimeloyl-ACP methyl ester carboxylesterase
VTYDAVGHKLGCSGGQMHHITQAAENLRQAVEWMKANVLCSGIAVVGHSMGAAAAIQFAAWESSKPDSVKPLRGIACLCMGVNPIAGFSTPLGASMLNMRSDYVSGAPAIELLNGLSGMLESADKVGPLPVLLVAARNDVLLPVTSVEKLGERIGPTAEVRTIEAMHLDTPEKSRGLVYRWLEGLARD